MSDETFFSRWLRLKKGAKSTDVVPAAVSPTKARARSDVSPPAVIPAQAGTQSPLPPIESLTPESDFTPFFREGVEEHVKRAALKTLFQDPRFNVMDGLDVYIDDYSKPDPLPEGWLEKMNQLARLGEYKAPEDGENTARDDENEAAEAPAAPAEPSDTAPPQEPSAEVKES